MSKNPILQSGGFRLLDPTGTPQVETFQLPERPASLDGKVLGILINEKINADVLFGLIEKKLCKRHNIKQVVWGKKNLVSRPAPASLVDELARQCDVAITGTGD